MTREEWRIVQARDAAWDGQLYCAMAAPRVVCNVSCGRYNRAMGSVKVFHRLEDALGEGYAPCSRCHPDRPGWKGAGADLVERAKAYIDAHSADKFSLSALSGALYVNGSYLLRTFRRHTGVTPLEYHNQARCEKAKALLSQGDLTISRVGELTGFASSAHFSRIFKKMTGLSPTAWRNDYFNQDPTHDEDTGASV